MKLLYVMFVVVMAVGVNSSMAFAETKEGTENEKLRTKCDDKKDMNACVELAIQYGDEDDFTSASKYLEKACDGGDMMGCGIQGHLYQEGMGVKQNYKKARKLFTKSCDGGEMAGCGALGDMYDEGLGVKQNSDKALELYKKACDGGKERGCSIFKTLYEKECSTDPADPTDNKKLCAKYK